MAVTVVAVEEEGEVSTAEAAVASMVVVAMAEAASMAEGTAAIAAVCTEVAATTEGWAEVRRQHTVPPPEELGLRRAEVFVTPRPDGIRFKDQATAAAWPTVGAWLQRTARALPTVSGTPSEARTMRAP